MSSRPPAVARPLRAWQHARRAALPWQSGYPPVGTERRRVAHRPSTSQETLPRRAGAARPGAKATRAALAADRKWPGDQVRWAASNESLGPIVALPGADIQLVSAIGVTYALASIRRTTGDTRIMAVGDPAHAQTHS